MVLRLLLTLLFCSETPMAKESCNNGPDSFECVQYIDNYDGDTVRFNIKGIHPILGQNISIRVNGIDTPEIRTKDKCEKAKSLEAKKVVKMALQNGKRIDLRKCSRGKYFRLVCDVVVDGASLSKSLLGRGVASEYDGGTKPKIDWCKKPRTRTQPSRKVSR